MSLREQTHYELLEIGPRASREEIQVAYNRSRAAFSQNSLAIYSLFSPEECALMQQRLDQAYQTLMNEDARRRYDESIGLSVDRAARPTPGSLLRLPPGPGPAVRGGAAEATTASSPVQAPYGAPPAAARVPGAGSPAPGPSLAASPVSGSPAATLPSAALPGESPQTPPLPGESPQTPLPGESPQTPLPGEGVVTGAYLRKVREGRGIELRQIAQTTKVGLTYLQFIEEENFRQLPVPAYLRGFLKAYARYVGLDPNRVSSDYLKLYALYHEIKGER